MDEVLPFHDRRDAGRRLGEALRRFADSKPFVLGLPRGGVPVAYEVARALGAPLDLALVRKLGAPGHPELGLGAVVNGSVPQIVLNDEVVRALRPEPGYIDDEVDRQVAELERRRRLYRDRRPPPALEGRTIILVDDGIATGSTVEAVLNALSRSSSGGVVLAVPVAPSDTLKRLAPYAAEVVCLATPEPFRAVGLHYRDFTQTTDEEVISLLEQSRVASEAGERQKPGQ